MNAGLNNNLSFNGKFSKSTLAKFQENLTPHQFKKVKKFRAGYKFTDIDIIPVQEPPFRKSNGTVMLQNSTYAEFTNNRFKNIQKSRIKLADYLLPFNFDTFKLITEDLVKEGEKLLKNFDKS